MIVIKNKGVIRKMRHAGFLLASLFDKLHTVLRPGMDTQSVDNWIAEVLDRVGLVSRTKGYLGYKHVSCISLNSEVVHGVPSTEVKLRAGDLVKVDVCASWKGYCADMARSFFVECDGVSSEKPIGAVKLVEAARLALDNGIAKCRAGTFLSDISREIQKTVEKHGFGVVRDFAGHGIGKSMHEAPEILNYGTPGRGPVLQAGMTFALEPMITAGEYDVYVANDGWTVRTVDKSLAAHVEDTVLVTNGDPEILTRTDRMEGI